MYNQENQIGDWLSVIATVLPDGLGRDFARLAHLVCKYIAHTWLSIEITNSVVS